MCSTRTVSMLYATARLEDFILLFLNHFIATEPTTSPT